jgi:N6-adenosine-specific RNA methylase IME4
MASPAQNPRQELAIPDPSAVIPPGYHKEARDWFAAADNPQAVDELRRRLAALQKYVRGKEAKFEVQAAARWAEVRIGELLGEGKPGPPPESSKLFEDLDKDERHWFRKMARHVPIVEDCIAGINDSGDAMAPKTLRAPILNEITKRTMLPMALPVGTFRAIVIDPPWPMPKIEREERPDQDSEIDYPTMSLGELAALPIADLADPEGAHLYLWVTHKFLPAGLELMAGWGFKYQCVMTWRKNVGITPFSWMYDTEHVLFGRCGSLPLDRLGLRLSFEAPVSGHSIKPDVFYQRVMQASPRNRLDMFARRERDGFTVWGNEVSDAS